VTRLVGLAAIKHDVNGVPDQLDRRPLVRVLVGLPFRPNDFVLVAGAVACERVRFGDVDGDDACAEEFLRRCDLIDEVPTRLSIRLANLLDREIAKMIVMGACSSGVRSRIDS